MDDFVIGEPIRFQNLTIFPVASRAPKSDDRFITLDEGLKAGSVDIREVGAMAAMNSLADASARAAVPNRDDQDEPISALESGQPSNSEPRDSLTNFVEGGVGSNDVNSLVVVNRSDKPLYLMPGEIIIGGSQDRTIGNELVIAPHSEPTRIPVYCVEHGRWGAKGAESTLGQIQGATFASRISDSVAFEADASADQLAREADQGKFVASVGQLSKRSRVAVQSDKDQSVVWANVADANSSSGVAPASGAFTSNYADVAAIQRLEPYLEKLQSPVANVHQVVGVLAAINGKFESIDVFESTPLFQKVWPKLLKSYALDAANEQNDAAESATECTLAAARTFFAEAMQANVAATEHETGVALTKREGQHVISFTSRVQSEAAAAPGSTGGMMGGGMGGGGVHFSGFSK